MTILNNPITEPGLIILGFVTLAIIMKYIIDYNTK